MKKKNEFIENAPNYYDTIWDAVEKRDYKLWFTNRLAKEYVSTLPERYDNEKDPNKRVAIYIEADRVAQIYAALVYYIYPNRESFRKEIDSDRELSKNFAKVRAWMDQNDGKEYVQGNFGFPAGKIA